MQEGGEEVEGSWGAAAGTELQGSEVGEGGEEGGEGGGGEGHATEVEVGNAAQGGEGG